jgi:guanylate kinase
MEKAKPRLFVITGPSGVGKGTILAEFLKENKNVKYSVSATTRPPRYGEADGVNYFFISRKEFQKIKDEDGFFWNGLCMAGIFTAQEKIMLQTSGAKGLMLFWKLKFRAQNRL